MPAAQVEPFIELQSPTDTLANDCWRLGFRMVGSLEVISELYFPAEVIWAALAGNISVDTSISVSGDVTCSLGPRSRDVDWRQTKYAIDELLEKAVHFDNLRMVEASVTDLTNLLQRLERSLSLTREAIRELQAGDRHD